MRPDWARSLRDQCVEADVPFLFKQWGEWLPIARAASDFHTDKPDEFQRVGDLVMAKVGVRQAGRLLDGQEWLQVPEPR